MQCRGMILDHLGSVEAGLEVWRQTPGAVHDVPSEGHALSAPTWAAKRLAPPQKGLAMGCEWLEGDQDCPGQLFPVPTGDKGGTGPGGDPN